MSVIDLVILGFTARKDQSAYDLVKEMQFRHLDEWIAISEQAIYKNTKKLEEKGFLEIYGDTKKMYRITSAGRACFSELMKEQIQNESLLYLNFAPVLMNITVLPQQEAAGLLRELQQKVAQIVPAIEEEYRLKQHLPPNATSILKLYLDIHKLIGAWLEDFTQLQLTEKGEDSGDKHTPA